VHAYSACCHHVCVLQVSEQELAQALEAAVTCCILAAAGPQRSRVLANLYKDERTRTLPVFPFLEKVYLERILQRAEVQNLPGFCAQVECGCVSVRRSQEKSLAQM